MDLSVTDLLPQPADRARRDAPGAKGRDGAFHDAMRAERDRERAARPEPETKSRPAEEPRRADEPKRTTEPKRKEEPAASETEAPAATETVPAEKSAPTETATPVTKTDASPENAVAPAPAAADATPTPKPRGAATVDSGAGQKTQATPEAPTLSGQPAKPAAEIAGAAQAAGGNSQIATALAATAAAPSLKADMPAATARPQQTSATAATAAAGGGEQPAAGFDASKLAGAGQGQQKDGQNAGGQGAQGGVAAAAKAALGGVGKVSGDAAPDFRMTADKPADSALPQIPGAATQGNGPPALLSTTALTVVSRTPPVHLPVTEQIGIRLQKAVSEGVDRISMSLKPAELGRVDIQMEVGFDGRVQAVISADRPDTLALLQRDARGLEQALQNAGLQADGDSLSFNLRDGGNSSRDGGSQSGGNGRSAAADSTADMPPPRTVRLGGVDLSV
ncbi:flagellar hook-length control protein FliK [Inquilinus sp. CAU 1745]|uniref:flagellar hook-length control protein FliK n=1 Tax=Inquilinus sp. CAU 1745 TaxID=3140369 RepID=UPI00325B7C70